jgi:predicted transcriptional regulator
MYHLNRGIAMSRTTSRMAYKKINEDGTATSQRQIILDMINDISNVNKSFGFSLKEISRQTGFEINAVSGRVNELKKDDLVKECTKRRCRITGRLITPVTFN